MRGNKLFKFLDFYVGIPLTIFLALVVRRKRDSKLSSREFKRILVVKLAALGDAALLIPALRALKKEFPHAEIVLLATTLTEPFLRQFPEYIDRIIVINISSLLRQPKYFFGVLRDLRTFDCDIAIDFEQWTRLVPLLLTIAQIPFRVGFKTKGHYRHFLYTHVRERNSNIHEVENFLALTELLGTKEVSKTLEVKVEQHFVQEVQEQLCSNGWDRKGQLIVLHPGCGVHGFLREWSPRSYAELASQLSHDIQTFFVITGTEQEADLMKRLKQSLISPASIFQISDLPRFVALLSIASLFVSGNNGAMHLAAALQIPQVALHGPTNPQQWGPLNPNALVIQSQCPQCPCLNLGFEYHRRDGYCMAQINVDEVHHAARMLLSKKNR